MATNRDPSPPRQNRNSEDTCAVCGDRPAFNSFGGISCSSCKMFFRRNETFDLSQNRCRFRTNCEITVETRRNCRYCRLKKCFEIGMQRELFRSSHGFNETNRPVQAQQDLQRTTTIQTLDLLEQNRSALTANDWTLLSNVLHAYDSKCPLKNIREQMEIQAKYPSKMRLKMVSANYMNLISHFYSTIVRFVEDIIHFSDLPPRDRLGLLHRNMASLGTFHGLFIVRELNLDQNYEYNYCATETYGPNISQRISRIASMLDQDGTLIKLLMAVLCFSTCHNYFLPDDRQKDLTSESNALSNTTNLLTIQSLYAEILFKYMVFRYGYEEASTRFATLIRVVLELNKCLAAIREVQPYQAMIQEILDDTERTISSEEST